MQLEKVYEFIDKLNLSPLRVHLQNMKDISFFEDEKIILKDIDRIIEINKENLKHKLKIVILGEVKAGKSTLVNTLIGKKVSYTNVVEATAAILEIKYSSKENVIIKKSSEENILLNSLKELDELIEGNNNNQNFFKDINNISILANTDRLKEIALVDTPGLNTVTIDNENRTEKYIANADVILWVLNAHHLGQSDVVEKIEKVLDYGKPIICIINRIDEINGDPNEIIDYVTEEMGYMFSEIFATSAKLGWDGYLENDSVKINESNIDNLYNYIVNNIEKNADNVQINSTMESIKVQLKKDVHTHQLTKQRIDHVVEKIQKDIEELKEFNYRTKEIINNKIIEWINNEFFEKEKKELIECTNDEYYSSLLNKYSNDAYIQKIINNQYEELNNYIIDQWKHNTDEFIKGHQTEDIKIEECINYNIKAENLNNNNVINGVKQGGMTAGAIGLGLSGYSAWLGPAAAYVSIGSAISTIMPPLLIAGIIGGGMLKVINSSKSKAAKHNQIEEIISTIKSSVKYNVINKMKENLLSVSDYYFNNSSQGIMSILEQCNTSYDEIKNINKEIDRYINKVEEIIIYLNNNTFSNTIIDEYGSMDNESDVAATYYGSKDIIENVVFDNIDVDYEDVYPKIEIFKKFPLIENDEEFKYLKEEIESVERVKNRIFNGDKDYDTLFLRCQKSLECLLDLCLSKIDNRIDITQNIDKNNFREQVSNMALSMKIQLPENYLSIKICNSLFYIPKMKGCSIKDRALFMLYDACYNANSKAVYVFKDMPEFYENINLIANNRNNTSHFNEINKEQIDFNKEVTEVLNCFDKLISVVFSHYFN